MPFLKENSAYASLLISVIREQSHSKFNDSDEFNLLNIIR